MKRLKIPSIANLLVWGYQAFFAAALIFFREIVILPSKFKAPLLTREYLIWYFDEYVPVFPDEVGIIAIVGIISVLFGLFFLCRCLLLLVENRTAPKRRFTWGVLIFLAGVVGRLAFLFYTKTYGQPYYLFFELIPGAIYSVTSLILFHLFPEEDSPRQGQGPSV